MPAAEKLFQTAQLAQDLSGLTHAHPLRPMKRILIEELLQTFHLTQGLTQLVQLFLGQGIQTVQKVIQILNGSVQHVGQVFKEILVLQEPIHPIQHLHEPLIALAREVLGTLHAASGYLVSEPVPEFLITRLGLLHPAGHLIHVVGVAAR